MSQRLNGVVDRQESGNPEIMKFINSFYAGIKPAATIISINDLLLCLPFTKGEYPVVSGGRGSEK
jgi:hypothetical protein